LKGNKPQPVEPVRADPLRKSTEKSAEHEIISDEISGFEDNYEDDLF